MDGSRVQENTLTPLPGCVSMRFVTVHFLAESLFSEPRNPAQNSWDLSVSVVAHLHMINKPVAHGALLS